MTLGCQCLFSSFFFNGFCLRDNFRTPLPILLKFLLVINHGHGKIPIVFQQDSKLIKDGRGVCPPPPFKHWMTQCVVSCRAITIHYLDQSLMMQKFVLLSILHYKYLYMKCSKFSSAWDGILFVMIPYNLMEFQHFHEINHCRIQTCGQIHWKVNTNTNTFQKIKYKYKYFQMQMYLNTNTFKSISNTNTNTFMFLYHLFS